MKTAISLPDAVFSQVEEASTRLGISRSEFFRTAAELWLKELKRDDLTKAIDGVIGDVDDDSNDEFLTTAARRLDS
jgi:metal-responsive CopG/Arc/MetJ family transcriptional regulator